MVFNWKYNVLFFLLFLTGYKNIFISQKKIASQNIGENAVETTFNEAIKKQNNGEFDSSIQLFEASLQEFKKQNNIKKIGDCLNYIAISFYYQAKYSKAIEYFEKSKIVYLGINDQDGVSSVLNNEGAIYFFLGQYPQALDSYKEVLQIQTRKKDQMVVGITSQNIGVIYSKVKDYENALKYYQKASDTFYRLKKKKEIAQNLNNKGFIYSQIAKFIEAEEIFNKAYKIANEQKDLQLQLEILSNIGNLRYKQNMYKDAEIIYKKSLNLANKLKSPQYIGNSYAQIGKIKLSLGDIKRAIKFCSESNEIAATINSISLQKEACDCLYDAYKLKGDSKLALNFFEKSNELKDSLQSEETANQMMNMEFENKKLLDSISFVKKEHATQIKHNEEIKHRENQRNAILTSLGFIVVVAGGLYHRLNFVKKSKKELQFEKDRSEKLLLNILPEEIAQELKEKGSVNARDFNLVTVLFSDFKSFTQTAQLMTPKELVEEINICFKAFDCIADKYNIEKIKTIGDAYMAAGGIPIPDDDFIQNTVFAAIEMQNFMVQRKRENDLLNKPAFEMRIGIHAGPIVAGIVGVKKFQYDVWGDTVNTASRIESNGTVGRVNISETLYKLLKHNSSFTFQYRGNIHAKGKGNINMYYVEGNHGQPNVLQTHEKMFIS